MEEKDRKPYIRRYWALGIVVTLVFVILSGNLWYLQISKGPYYATLAAGNFRQTVPVPAMRGDIKDTKGELLVTSVPKFVLTLDWLDLQKAKEDDWKEVVYRLAEYLQPYWPNQAESVNTIAEDILVLIQNQQWERYRPVTILTDVPESLQAVIAEHQEELPGVSVDAVPVREYPEKTLAGQTLGYVREISDEEIASFNEDPLAKQEGFVYREGDLVGKMGVEKSYDFWLRGSEGIQEVEVDNNARPVSKRVIQESEPGKTVQLTIDAELQRATERKLDEVIANVQKKHPEAQAGAAVVINVNTGAILAMVSRPAMDPNDLTGIITDEAAEKYFRSKDAASLNRALSGLYPPGSTYKMMTAMGALESGSITPEETVWDSMSSLGNASAQAQGFPEWGGNNFGAVNIYRGLAKSSDIYFEVLGRRTWDKDPELMRKLSHEFGLGVSTKVDLPGEALGIAPSPEWKKEYYTPYYDKQRDKKLAEIETKYAPKLAEAKTEKEKQKIQKAKDNEKAQVESWYRQMIQQYVDWHLYDSFNNAIGQGYNAYTPLQLANYVATIVNGGKRMQPYIVDKIIDPVTGEVVKQNEPQVLNTVSVSQENLQVVKKAMSGVTGGEGTAGWLFADVPEFSGGAKTGTAQIGSRNTILEEVYNGLFVAFAPYDKPEIAFAGVVEYGGHGGDTAGYVAKEAFKQYFGWKSTNGR